jgi:hypothetical protein
MVSEPPLLFAFSLWGVGLVAVPCFIPQAPKFGALLGPSYLKPLAQLLSPASLAR